MNSDERSFNNILKAAGVFLIIIGALSIWRGIFRLMPYAGFQYGLVFSIVGGVFALLGVVFLTMSIRKQKQWKKALEEQKEKEP